MTNQPPPEMVERAEKLFPCNCKRFKDGSHWHDCQSQYQDEVAAELERVREETKKENNALALLLTTQLEERIAKLESSLSPGPCGKHPKMFWVETDKVPEWMVETIVGKEWEQKPPYCFLCQEIKRLVDALKDMVTRFERCAKHSGSDDEFVAIATEKARKAIVGK